MADVWNGPIATPGPSVREDDSYLKRRLGWTISVLCVIVVGSLVLSALYTHVYVLPFRLPDIKIEAAVLARTYLTFVPMLGVLTMLVAALGSEHALAWLDRRWRRLNTEPVRTRQVALGTAVVGAIAFAFVRVHWGEQVEGWRLVELTAGEGQTPFQYRTLVLWLVQSLAALGVFDSSSPLQLQWVYGTFEAFAALGAILAFTALLRTLAVEKTASLVLALALFYPLYFSLAASYRYANLFFPWDTPSVALFTLGIVLLLRRKWTAYYVLFAVSTVNRETTCFLTMLFVILEFGRASWGTLAKHVAGQFVIWVAIKAGIAWFYLDNLSGSNGHGLFWLMADGNLDILQTLPGLAYLLQAMGGLWVVVLLLLPWVCDARLKRSLLVAIPFFAGMLMVGIVTEVRVFSELIPLVLAAFLLICKNIACETLARRRRMESAKLIALR